MSVENWRYAQASVIGQAHINQNTECQDRLLCRLVESEAGEILIAVVADGAGSTTHGQIGAELACELFVNQVEGFLKTAKASVESLNAEFGKLWLNFFQSQIAEIANRDKKEMREYASTLVGAVVGAKSAAFFQVGDGGAVYSVDGTAKTYQFAVAPTEAEYVNMTEFLTDDAAINSLRFVFVEETIEDLILFSDGIFAVAVDYQTNQPHEPFLMPMIAPLRNGRANEELNEKLENFLQSPKINEKTDDDKTIILASRRKISF